MAASREWTFELLQGQECRHFEPPPFYRDRGLTPDGRERGKISSKDSSQAENSSAQRVSGSISPQHAPQYITEMGAESYGTLKVCISAALSIQVFTPWVLQAPGVVNQSQGLGVFHPYNSYYADCLVLVVSSKRMQTALDRSTLLLNTELRLRQPKLPPMSQIRGLL